MLDKICMIAHLLCKQKIQDFDSKKLCLILTGWLVTQRIWFHKILERKEKKLMLGRLTVGGYMGNWQSVSHKILRKLVQYLLAIVFTTLSHN